MHTWGFSGCGEWGYALVVADKLLTGVTSLLPEQRL